jgi:hypothetical protein
MEDLFSSQGFWKLGLILAAVLYALFQLVRKPDFAMIFVGGMLFLSALGLTEDAEKFADTRVWLYPLQVNRQLAYAACAGMVMLGAAIHSSKVNSRTIPGLGLGMLALGVYMGVILIFQKGAVAGFAAIFLAIFSMGAVMILLASQLRSWDDFAKVLRILTFVGCVWTLACTIQFLSDQTRLTTGYGMRRFVGLSGNPQHAAGLSAVMATVGFWVLLNDRAKFWKLLASIAASTHIIFVLWTASRTGLALTVIGFTGILYARIGRAIFFAPVAGGMGYALLTVAQNMGVQFGFERLSSREDTRSDKWQILWETGMSSPVIGVGLEDAGGSENGFLYGFASFGIGVPVIMVIILLFTIGVCLRLIKARFDTPDPVGKRLIDLTIAFFLMYWAGNIFEGFGVARISPQLTYFLIFACFATSAITISQDERHALEEMAMEAEQEQGEYYPDPIRMA